MTARPKGLGAKPRAQTGARARNTFTAAPAGAANRVASVATRTPKAIGPEQAGHMGDLVAAARIDATAAEVLAAKLKLDKKIASDPGVLARLREAPFPRSGAEQQLEWALARPSGLPNLSNPVWTTATNDDRSALVAFTRGVLDAQAQGIAIDGTTEAAVLGARDAVLSDFSQVTALQQQPFPAAGTLDEQLRWAVAASYAWDWTSNPAILGDPKAKAVVSLVTGVLAKDANNGPPVALASERHTLKIDGDTRVYAVHTPPGRPPAGGWPTVFFFHGSFGGHAPEQNEEYQQLNALADAHGYQVVYPVGLPQDRADPLTGRGMLNWDPVGAGPGGANDRFVHALLHKLTAAKGATHANPERIFAAGHSQGGFYVSDLVAAYPDVFAGAMVLGAGMGTVAEGADVSALKRKTPTLLRVGKDDMHIGVGEKLAARFEAGGFGDALRFDRMEGRGHEVLPDDFEAMLQFFESQPDFDGSKAGALDGKTGDAKPRPPVFRDALDLRALPPQLQANPAMVRVLQALAANPFLVIDGDQQTVTSQEWRLALQYLNTFPPAMQQAITALRPYYVVAGPPSGRLIDVANPPPQIASSPTAMAALSALASGGLVDLDGYPGLFTAEEAASAYDLVSMLPPQAQAGVAELRDYFFGAAAPQGPDLRPRGSESLPGGARLESYPDSELAKTKLKALVAGLSKDPTFAALLAKTTLIISPPGRGLEAVPEAEGLGPGVEGVASAEGFDGGGRRVPGPAFMVREDSIRQWALGAGHELLHLLRAAKGPAAGAQVAQVWQQIGGKDGQPDGYPNAEEMFAYFGQWYLAGFGEQLRTVSPEAWQLCRSLIGDARIDPGVLNANDALSAMQNLLGWFRSGQHH